MYVNMVDDLFDGIINKFNIFLINEKAFQKLNSDTNFVKFQNDILSYIKKFIDTIPKKDIIEIIKNDSYYESILNIIKRYCAFYIYLGIGYYYEGGRDLFVTNIIEASRYQKDSTFQITNFFNSENNSKIITFYNDIKNFLSLLQYKTIDKIKIILLNNPLRFESTIKLFNDLGEDHIVEYFLVKENFHNVMKALIFKQIYLKEEKNEIINMLNQQEKADAEYKYIEIIVSNEKKIVDFNVIQKFLTIEQRRQGMAEEIYAYLEEMREVNEYNIKEGQEFINYLFVNKIIIPITEEFLRFHKDTEKYDPESLVQTDNINERDATKIKYIISKMNNVRNYYSPLLDKNPKLKLDTEKLFYKHMDPKKAVLYNNDEEIRIIQKLELSENANDFDLLVDLQNIRKYTYVNFKNFSKDGFKIRPTITIQGIRYTNIGAPSKNPIDTRIGHDSIDMNVVGVAWNPAKKPLDCFTVKQMKDSCKEMNDMNGFNAFMKVMKKTIMSSKPKANLYYWLFDNTKDRVKSDKYIDYSTTDKQHNIKIMINEIYNNYIDMIQTKFNMYIDSVKELDIWTFNNLLKGYMMKYFNFNLTPHIKNQFLEKVIIEKIPELEIIEDDVDSMMPGKRDKLIILPLINKKIYEKKMVILGVKEIDYTIELAKKSIPVCYHYIRWHNIIKMSKKSDDFNQAIFDFVKQYVKLDDHGEYMCKSCNEKVNIQKYVFEGTYVEELDTFMTTSMAVNQRLEEIPKYAKYMRTIRNIEKSIEKFAYSLDINSYLGNDPIIKLRRKMIIKDIIDLILMHTTWLRLQPKNRIENANKKYGINKDLTNLFFFELKDEIFLTSSTDTDYYKLIKYNNIMAYLILVIITELNSGQILGLKEDKKINYFMFKKFGFNLFNDLYLRINMKDKVPLNRIPLLAYILYYLSGMMVTYRLWLYNDKDIEIKERPLFQLNTQKIIIHTVLDLINSLVEANLEQRNDNTPNSGKNFLYEIINTRINEKIKHTYNDDRLLSRIEAQANKNISFDETTKKIIFHTKKIEPIQLNIDYNIINNPVKKCDLATSEIQRIPYQEKLDTFDILTNCSDGKFHNWVYKSGDMICNNCNKSYNDMLKLLETSTESSTNNNEYLDKIKLINLKKLAKKYCISGELHDPDNMNKCTKCNILINDFKPTDKELKQLEKNIDIKTNDITLSHINMMRSYNDMIIKQQESNKETLKLLNKIYDDNISKHHNITNIINNFVDRLSKILGTKIKVKDATIYLKETVYIVDHDYFGNNIKTPIVILSSENKINYTHNHNIFKKDVLWYKDKASNIFVYYDAITLQHLGYSEDNKTMKKSRNNVALKIELSIADCIKYLGYENKYFNIYHINKDYMKRNMTDLGNDTYEVILNIIRSRINNLKQVIERTKSIVYNIRNSGKINSIYNIEEKEIINEFTKKLKVFNITGDIFNFYSYIIDNFAVNYNIPDNINIELNKNYLNVDQLIALGNTDIKLIFFLIHNFNMLLDANNTPIILSELAHLIIKIIKFIFNLYYRPYSNFNIRKFDFLLINETPYIDETLKVVGHYMELLNQAEIDDPDKKEQEYSAHEAFDSIDIDDYDKDEDNDETAGAFDGYED